MDLDSGADQDSPIQPPTRTFSDHRANALQNLPQLTDFPTRKPFTPPPASSAASTPPIFQPTRKAPEGLREKEMQIEEMRRKIAEAEAAKAQKLARQNSNGSRTPHSASGNIEKPINGDSLAKKIEASVQIQKTKEATQDKIHFDMQLVEAQVSELEKSAVLKKDGGNGKQTSSEKLASQKAQSEEKQRKLKEIQAQMAQLAEEMKRLEAEVSHT